MSEKPTRRMAVILQRTPLASRWADHAWHVLSAIPDVGGEARVILERDGIVQKVFPGFEVILHPDEAEGFYLNVSSEKPCIFVSLREAQDGDEPYPFQVTASYNEAARWMDGGERVETASIDLAMASWIGAWVESNYRPEPRQRIRPKSFKGRGSRFSEEG